MTDPRHIALDLLTKVLNKRQAFDDALAQHPGFPKLEQRDRNFVRVLVYTVLRRAGELDAIIAPMLKRPLPKKALAVRTILWMGAAQLLYLDTKPHAAVGTAVDLAANLGFMPFKGVVNAILRNIVRKPPVLDSFPPNINTPAWLWDSWMNAYGAENAADIARAHLTEAPLDIAVKRDPEMWAEKLEAQILPTGALRRPAGGDIRTLAGYEDGEWWVQDAAAQLPVKLLGDVTGKRVVDLCAAPGGKTAQLAAAGAQVVAVDRSEKRMQALRDNLARLKLTAETVVADATTWQPHQPADIVLLDAPCSATGTIRRHPDLPYLKRPEDLARLADVQMRLLENAANIVRPGGTILYVTCSLQPEEGENVISSILSEESKIEPEPFDSKTNINLSDAQTADGHIRTLPCHWTEQGGMDGFFISQLKRPH